MNLHDPKRPKILHKPAFTSGFHVIPRLQIWPKGNEQIELAMMLPVPDSRFMGKWYTKEVHHSEVHFFICQFEYDPEEFVMELFNLDVSKLGRSVPESKDVSLNVAELLTNQD